MNLSMPKRFDSDWSFSNFQTFKECNKTLQYIANSARTRISPFPVRATVGIIVHETISFHVARWSKGIDVSANDLRNIASDSLREAWNDKDHRIIEQMNGFDLDSHLFFKFQDSIYSLLDNFLNFAWIRFLNHKYLAHEQTFSLVLNGINLFVKPDLITENKDKMIIITDWKTGLDEEMNDYNLQMNSYGLWAASHFSINPEYITVQLVNLKTGVIRKKALSGKDLKNTEEEIMRQIDEMTRLFKTRSLLAIPERNKCKSCPYLKECPEGLEVFKN